VEDADQHLDVLSWNITGGEPLLTDILWDLLPALKPQTHYISVQTNATLLTEQRAQRLAKLGVNCITTSLDSNDPQEHNTFRGMKSAYEKTLQGLENAKRAGMQILVAGVITHQNLRTPELRQLIKKANDIGAIFLYNLAVPCGRWVDETDMILRGDDRQYLKQLMVDFPLSSTDHEPGRNAIGCPAGMEKIYITAFGDVIPCPFIHISFGNVQEEALHTIVDKMQKVDFFSQYQPVCIAAEDPEMHKVFRQMNQFKQLPVKHTDIFPDVNEQQRTS